MLLCPGNCEFATGAGPIDVNWVELTQSRAAVEFEFNSVNIATGETNRGVLTTSLPEAHDQSIALSTSASRLLAC